ncbi:putative ribonuclease H-like domain, reverse transcriptase zinc-binding domain-containing protein [Rosa chinensis]|uniref:Putative ribonuclease H-like domain, reverse transcriptase zinc-binding domain-containing protein n=1 Tax=Rosa chinensis TaxID=74649 RepID=A0A2P6RAJ5_ROSCH|nr:putative ribonuclease H-like domain, reverse transcriptase zinc-binding domain-containing protein [Rosa chinensis]
MAMKDARESLNGQQVVPVVTEHWRHLWKLRVPPKMSHFLWRCSTGYLPCMWALFQRWISNSSMCPRCHVAEETPLHATRSCSLCVAVLERASFYLKLNPGTSNNFSSFIEHAIQVLTLDEMKLLIIILWSNWNERNLVVHGGQPRPALVIFNQCYSIWTSLITVQERETCDRRNNGVIAPDIVRWTPPSPQGLKLNCGESVSNNGSHVGIGALIRGGDGNLVLAVGERLIGRLQPCAAELQALILGLEVMVENGWRMEKVETDCLEAVQLVNGCDDCLAPEGVLVDKVRMLLASVGIQGISHVPRSVNGAAYVIAKSVARLNGRFSWLGVGPHWLMDVVADDRPVTHGCNRAVGGNSLSTTGFSHIL